MTRVEATKAYKAMLPLQHLNTLLKYQFNQGKKNISGNNYNNTERE